MKTSKFQSVPAYSFGVRRNEPCDRPKVGPGSYEIPSDFGSGQKSKFPQDPRSKQSNNGMPGPGQYDPNDQTTTHSHKAHSGKVLTTTPRLPNHSNANPGPGQYYDEVKSSTLAKNAGKIGKDPREKDFKNSNPGPGHYTTDLK
jgi:Sperm-tail PG-rich repeat